MRRAQRLQFGPYKQPRYRLGQKVDCERRGELTIVGTSSGRIPWPVGFGPGGNSLVLYGDLVRAVRQEASVAIRFWWRVDKVTIWKWRKVLKVPMSNPGTREIRRAVMLGKKGPKIRAAAALTLDSPVRREKIRAKALGRKHSAKAKAKMRARMLGMKLSDATRRKMSEVAKRLGRRPPKIGPPWSTAEDELCRTQPPAEVSVRTGRTMKAVYKRRADLGLVRGRTIRHGPAADNRASSPVPTPSPRNAVPGRDPAVKGPGEGTDKR